MMPSFAKKLIPSIQLCGRWNNTNLVIVILVLPSVFFEQVGIELIEPLPMTPKRNRYIITLVDYFSKWLEAEALPGNSAEGVAHFLYKMMFEYDY